MEAVALSLKTIMQESPNLTIINWNIKCEDKQLKKSIRLENYQYVWEKNFVVTRYATWLEWNRLYGSYVFEGMCSQTSINVVF